MASVLETVDRTISIEKSTIYSIGDISSEALDTASISGRLKSAGLKAYSNPSFEHLYVGKNFAVQYHAILVYDFGNDSWSSLRHKGAHMWFIGSGIDSEPQKMDDSTYRVKRNCKLLIGKSDNHFRTYKMTYREQESSKTSGGGKKPSDGPSPAASQERKEMLIDA